VLCSFAKRGGAQAERQSSCHHKQGGEEARGCSTGTAMSPGRAGARRRETAKATRWPTADDYEANREMQRNSLNLRWHLRANFTFSA